MKYFSFFAFRILYRIILVSHHISGKHLLLCLSVLMSKKNALSPMWGEVLFMSL